MKSPEATPSGIGVEAFKSSELLRVRGKTYELLLTPDTPFANLKDKEGRIWTDLSLLSRLDTDVASDETVRFTEPVITYTDDIFTIRTEMKSTAWDKKTHVIECREDNVEMYDEVEGQGKLLSHELLGGILHDKRSGSYPSRKYFSSLFNPEPTSSEIPERTADEPVHIDVNGSLRPGHIDWFATPAPWCYAARNKDSIRSLMMGLAVPTEQQTFSSFAYHPYEDSFSFSLDYQGHTTVDGQFRTPSLVLHFTEGDPYQGLSDHTAQLEQRALLPAPKPARRPRWWARDIYCGWGEQVEIANLQDGTKPQDLARQDFYDRSLGILASQGIVPGTVTIDDKWQLTHGRNDVNPHKWPDLPSWIDARHRDEQKVLLWRTLFSAEGVDPDLCITDPEGRPLSIDPNNPDWQDMTRQDVQRMLGADGYDADGYKIDFTADVPYGRYLTSKGPLWGTALLHSALKTVYDAAKDVKPDALIVTHTPNPQFTDVTDMLRLNDVNFKEPVIAQMRHRAAIIKAVAPQMLIDTDDWMMPDIETWRDYFAIKRSIGVRALYFATHVAGTEMSDADYAMLRQLEFGRRR